MNIYLVEIEKAKDLLGRGDYNLCSMLCGKIIENGLRDLVQNNLGKASPADQKATEKYLAIRKKKSVDGLSLGQLSELFEKIKLLSILTGQNDPKKGSFLLVDLKKMVVIRNQATHGDKRDEDSCGDAHIIYGILLNFLKMTGLLITGPQTGIRRVETPKEKTATPILPKFAEKGGPPPPHTLPKRDVPLKVKQADEKRPSSGLSADNVQQKFVRGEDDIPQLSFQHNLRVRFRHIYSVIYFMNCGYGFQEAVNKALGLFANVKDYQTIEDKCARGFAGNVDTFIRWYHSGEILNRLAGKFGLTSHDYAIFKELSPGKAASGAVKAFSVPEK